MIPPSSSHIFKPLYELRGDVEHCRRKVSAVGNEPAESRRSRFGGAVSDEFVRRYAEPSALNGVIIYGFFVDGVSSFCRPPLKASLRRSRCEKSG
jgi:hypothetical protein